MDDKSDTVRFYYSEGDRNNNFLYLEKKKKLKFKLYLLRKYFAKNYCFFVLFKIVLGLLFLGLPIFIFYKKLANYTPDENFSCSANSLIMSVSFLIVLTIGLIIFKIHNIVKNHL